MHCFIGHAHGFLFKERSSSQPTHPTAAAFFRGWLDSFATFHFWCVGLKPHPPSDHSGFATLTSGRVGGKQNSLFQVPLLEPKWHQRGTCALSVTKTLVFVSRHAHGFLFKERSSSQPTHPTAAAFFRGWLDSFATFHFWCVGLKPHPPSDHSGFATLTSLLCARPMHFWHTTIVPTSSAKA